MTLSLRVVYLTLTGALGALVAWLLLDVILDLQPGNPYLDAVLNGAILGMAIGIAVKGFEGLLELKPGAVVRGVLIGGLGGLLGGAFGLLLAELLYQVLGASAVLRILGWGVFGLILGLIEGALSGSWHSVLYRHGVLYRQHLLYTGVGGLIGGLLGGAAFYGLADISTESYGALSNTSRALGFALLGGSIGCFVGLAPVMIKNIARQPTLKVISSGRNEGKERLLDRGQIRIGTDPRCELSLNTVSGHGARAVYARLYRQSMPALTVDDTGINPIHAEISLEQGQYVLKPWGESCVVVRDHKVEHYILQDGDQFEIGQEVILFRRG